MASFSRSKSPKSARRIETADTGAPHMEELWVPKAPNPPGGLKPSGFFGVRLPARRSKSPKSARRIETQYRENVPHAMRHIMFQKPQIRPAD